MKFWWVNQNQTYKHEITGGYLWSPKLTKVGRKTPFYDYMIEVKPGDLIFSFVDTKIRAIGVAQENCISKDRPLEFGQVGELWDKDGWYVSVKFKEFSKENRIRLKEDIEQLRPYLDFKHAPLSKETGNGKELYLTTVTSELAFKLASLLNVDLKSIRDELYNEEAKADEAETHIREDPMLSDTTKKALINARCGQGKFKRNVTEINDRCFFTGLSDINFLRASHIKPWAESNNKERLDGNNGLLLVPHIDHLFDKGYITFMGTGALVISPQLPNEVINIYQLSDYKTDRKLNDQQRLYMEYHRNNIFKKE